MLKATSDTQAKMRLKVWLKRYQFHTSGVVSKFSNGIMEGTNNKKKLIKRRVFGYRNDTHFFFRLRLETGY